MNIQPHEIIGALAALGVYPPRRVVIKRAVLSNDITGLSAGSALTPITWDTGDFDPLEPTRIYVPPGFSHALIAGQARVDGTGAASIRIRQNGNGTFAIGYNYGTTASPASISACAQMWPVSGGDYFELLVNRFTSLTDILSDSSATSFSLTLFP